jgi:hypothetical protein
LAKQKEKEKKEEEEKKAYAAYSWRLSLSASTNVKNSVKKRRKKYMSSKSGATMVKKQIHLHIR